MTSSNGNIFRVTGHLCGEFTGPRWNPAQKPVTRSFYVFFDLRLNKRLSKQSWGWWFETLSRPSMSSEQLDDCPSSREWILRYIGEYIIVIHYAVAGEFPAQRVSNAIFHLMTSSWLIVMCWMYVPKVSDITKVNGEAVGFCSSGVLTATCFISCQVCAVWGQGRQFHISRHAMTLTVIDDAASFFFRKWFT